jgi:Lsr2
MAQKVEVTFVCDHPRDEHKKAAEAEEGVETIRFGWGASEYEIDLCKGHRETADEVFRGLLQFSRKVSGRGIRAARSAPGPRSDRRTAAGREQRADIRRWAIANGHKVSDRGRIAESIVREYEQAHEVA